VTRLALAVALTLQAGAPLVFDAGRAWEHLRQLVAIGPRPSGSAAIEQSRTYIKNQLRMAGLQTVEQAWVAETPVGPVHMVNLIATIPGTSSDRLIVAGHYDTKRFREFRFVGANDGGSSAAMLIELARVLKARPNALTIECLFLDGEEALVEWAGTDHTYGSRYYVEAAKRAGSLRSAKALVLLDMVGDRNLTIKREQHSTPWLTEAIWAAARRLDADTVFVQESTPIEDDHLEFLAGGVPSVDIIDLDYPAWHTAADTLEAVSARSLQVVGDVVLAALPQIEARLTAR
jgi:Zn-dependent M28 family amino/carboxypeptidase